MKKLSIFCLALTLFLLYCSKPAKRKNDNFHSIKSEIHKHNSKKFKKYVFIGGEKIWRLIKKEEFLQISNSNYPFLITIYTDEGGTIYKFVRRSFHPESGIHMIEYFLQGSLSLLIYYGYVATEYGQNGAIYFYNNSPIKIDTISDIYNIKTFKKIRQINLIPPKKYLSYHLNITELKKEYNIEAIDFTKHKPVGICTFKIPRVKDKTYINANDVLLREQPTTKSKAINKFNTLSCVKILDIDKQEEIGEWGKHNWYKVASCHDDAPFTQNGYVFGAFLEPVEVEVK